MPLLTGCLAWTSSLTILELTNNCVFAGSCFFSQKSRVQSEYFKDESRFDLACSSADKINYMHTFRCNIQFTVQPLAIVVIKCIWGLMIRMVRSHWIVSHSGQFLLNSFSSDLLIFCYWLLGEFEQMLTYFILHITFGFGIVQYADLILVNLVNQLGWFFFRWRSYLFALEWLSRNTFQVQNVSFDQVTFEVLFLFGLSC